MLSSTQVFSTENNAEYILVDTPGKLRTLWSIKCFIFSLLLLMITYGFVFDKWSEPKVADEEKKTLGKNENKKEGKSKKEKEKKEKKEEKKMKKKIRK